MLPQDLLNYFLYPKETGYTVQKTLLYSLILIAAVYLVFKILKRLGIKIDKRLAISVTPYVVFGSALRVLEDLGLVDSYWFVTPGIYILVFLITISVLLISLILNKTKKIPYYKPLFLIGVLLDSFVLTFIKPVDFSGMALVLAFLAPWIVAFALLQKWSLKNRIVTLVQLFDANTTFVAVSFFGFYEQHVVPTFFINFLSPISFVIVKLFVIVGILILIDRYSKDQELNDYLKLIIGILGAATGVRDFLALSVF